MHRSHVSIRCLVIVALAWYVESPYAVGSTSRTHSDLRSVTEFVQSVGPASRQNVYRIFPGAVPRPGIGPVASVVGSTPVSRGGVIYTRVTAATLFQKIFVYVSYSDEIADGFHEVTLDTPKSDVTVWAMIALKLSRCQPSM
jgi:hypothetical protein